MPLNKAPIKHLTSAFCCVAGLFMINFTQKAFSEITTDQIIQDYYEEQIKELNLNNRYYQTAKYFLIIPHPRLVISDAKAKNQDLNIEDNNNFAKNNTTDAASSNNPQAQDADLASQSNLNDASAQLQFINEGTDLYPDSTAPKSQSNTTSPSLKPFVSINDATLATSLTPSAQPSIMAGFGGIPSLGTVNISSGGTGSGSGGGSSGGGGTGGTGGGSSGGSGGGGGTTPEELCRSLTKTQTTSRLAVVNTELATKQQDVNLIYEKGMLLFCLGEYKKSGLELAKIYVIDPQNKLLNDGDNTLVENQFIKSLAAYKANPDAFEIDQNGQSIINALEEKNAKIDLYVGELSKDYQYGGNGKTNFLQEASDSFKYYSGSDAQLKQDLGEIYGSDAAEDVIMSRTEIKKW
jgi:hypothetical protein